ncbi:MAG: hypothetical protein R3Y46_00010 [Opitutales bacterium]
MNKVKVYKRLRKCFIVGAVLSIVFTGSVAFAEGELSGMQQQISLSQDIKVSGLEQVVYFLNACKTRKFQDSILVIDVK